MKLAKRDVRRGFFDKVLREKHALVARMRAAPPIARPRFAPQVSVTERLAATGEGVFVAMRRPDAPSSEDRPATATIDRRTPPSNTTGAIFVATDAPFFGGSLDLLARVRTTAEARGAARAAVVAFDFVVDPIQIARAAAFGADAAVIQPALVGSGALDAIVAEAARIGVELVADVSTQVAADAARTAGIGALLVSTIDWDLLRARSLPTIDPSGAAAYLFADEDAAAAVRQGFVACVTPGSLDDALGAA